MKIAIRKKCFETNSSSNHTLIITNEEDLENDKAQFLKEEEDDFFAQYGNFCKPLKTKEEKCYFMADLFHKENKDFGYVPFCYELEFEEICEIIPLTNPNNRCGVLKESTEFIVKLERSSTTTVGSSPSAVTTFPLSVTNFNPYA